jgi:hypothetical protein
MSKIPNLRLAFDPVSKSHKIDFWEDFLGREILETDGAAAQGNVLS